MARNKKMNKSVDNENIIAVDEPKHMMKGGKLGTENKKCPACSSLDIIFDNEDE